MTLIFQKNKCHVSSHVYRLLGRAHLLPCGKFCYGPTNNGQVDSRSRIWSWFLFLSGLGSFICICIFLFVFLYLHHLIVICTLVRTWGLFLCLYLFICIFIFVSFDYDLFSCQDLEEDSVLPCYCFSSQFLFAGFNSMLTILMDFIWLVHHLNHSYEYHLSITI